MARGDTGRARRAFFGAFLRGLRVLWPILSGLFAVIAGLGAVVGAVEGWGVAQGVYFAFITGLTIGYGDLAPSRALTKILATVVGFLGIAAARARRRLGRDGLPGHSDRPGALGEPGESWRCRLINPDG